MQDIEARELLFDAGKIEADVHRLLATFNLDPHRTYTLNHRAETEDDRQRLLDFPGSLDHRKNGVKDIRADEYVAVHPGLTGTYTEEVITQVRAQSEHPVGRIRWAALAPKSCYSYHIDADPVRFHVPIKTHPKRCMFIISYVVHLLPEEGRLYAVNVQAPHTAVNAMAQGWRVHLLFDTYDPADPLAHTHMGAFNNA